MPAYFGISLQFRREDLYPGFAADFDAALERAGLEFSSGCWEDEGLSQAEIAAWNQQKLEANFELGMTEHYSHGYKQSLYRFGDYSEVRGYWMNRYPGNVVFTYYIIIPESEVVDPINYTIVREDKKAELVELCRKIWQFPAVKAIQTEDEGGGPPIKLGDLHKGFPALAFPFAIVERDCHPYDDGSRVIELTQGRPGLLLLEEDEVPGPLIEVPGGGLLRLEEKDP